MQLTNIGNYIKEKRLHLGLTQFKIAELANIDEKHYGKIERNECSNPKIKTFLQICNALNIEPTTLLKQIIK